MKYKIGQEIYRLPPCPAWDIAGMESWLAEMAEKGLHLAHDGFFCGFAGFVCGEPQKVRYRLEAAQRKTGLWSDNDGEPEKEEIELGEKYSWEYVAKRGDFFIYRTADPSARELHTDPTVQALALNAVKKRKRGAVLDAVVLLVVYPILMTRGCLLLTAVSMGTWWTALVLLFAVLMIAGEVKAWRYLSRIQKALTEDGFYSAEPNGKKRRAAYCAEKAVKIVLAVVLACALLRNWGVTVTNENQIALADYTADLPFATIADLAGENSTDYRQNMTAMGREFNTLEEKTDILAPRMIEYNEEASVRQADGRLIDGGLYVEYYKMRNEKLAEWLTEEIYRFEKLKKHFEPLTAPPLKADFAAAYRDELHFPTVLIRKGRVVIKTYFYQTSAYKIPLETWTEAVCEGLEE